MIDVPTYIVHTRTHILYIVFCFLMYGNGKNLFVGIEFRETVYQIKK